MHGKAQREPAQRAVSPTLTKLDICTDYRRHLANMILPKCVANVSLQLVLRANFREVGKNSPSVLSRLWTKVYQIWVHVGESLQIDEFLSDC